MLWEGKHLGGDDYPDLISGAVPDNEYKRLTEIFTFHKTVCDGTANTPAGLFLVTIVASTVEETVSNFDGVVNHLQTHINERSQATTPISTHILASGIGDLKWDENVIDKVDQRLQAAYLPQAEAAYG